MAKAKAITYLDTQAPVAMNARLIAKARLAELYQWEPAVDAPANIRALHDMRIAAKRLRYTFESRRKLPEHRKSPGISICIGTQSRGSCGWKLTSGTPSFCIRAVYRRAWVRMTSDWIADNSARRGLCGSNAAGRRFC